MSKCFTRILRFPSSPSGFKLLGKRCLETVIQYFHSGTELGLAEDPLSLPQYRRGCSEDAFKPPTFPELRSSPEVWQEEEGSPQCNITVMYSRLLTCKPISVSVPAHQTQLLYASKCDTVVSPLAGRTIHLWECWVVSHTTITDSTESGSHLNHQRPSNTNWTQEAWLSLQDS